MTTSALLTARQLADMLGLSPATVLRRWRTGELPGYRLASNVVRFDPDEIAQWLEARRAVVLEAQKEEGDR
jgi:excisionase family DNA binding protein